MIEIRIATTLFATVATMSTATTLVLIQPTDLPEFKTIEEQNYNVITSPNNFVAVDDSNSVTEDAERVPGSGKPGHFYGMERDKIMEELLGTPATKLTTSNWPRSKADANMKTIEVKVRNKQGKTTTKKLRVHKLVADDMIAIFNEIYETTDFRIDTSAIGAYNYRGMASNRNNLSYHSLGTAIDINHADMPYTPNITPEENKKRWQEAGTYDETLQICSNDHPVVKIFAKYGFKWGGNWDRGYIDQMHFSLTDN